MNIKLLLAVVSLATCVIIAGCVSSRLPGLGGSFQLPATRAVMTTDSSSSSVPQSALLPVIANSVTNRWYVDTNKPAKPFSFGLTWPWTPTNGPVFFRIWMATNVTGPWTIIDTNWSTTWPDVFTKHVMPTQRVAFFHVTAFNYNAGLDSGWVSTNQ